MPKRPLGYALSGRGILRQIFQGISRGDPRGPTIYHYIKCGCRCGNTTLVQQGDGYRGGGAPKSGYYRGVLEGCASFDGVLLCRRWNSRVDAGNPPPAGVWYPEEVVWTCGPSNQCCQDGNNGLQDMSRDWGSLCRGLRPLDDGRGTILLRMAPPESPLTWLQQKPGGRVPGGPPTSPAWGGPGVAEGTPHPPPPRRGQYLPAIVCAGSIQHHLPSGRMPGASNEPKRTPGKLCAPPHAGHGSDPGGWESPTTVLTQVWHVRHTEGAEWKTPGHRDVHQGGEREGKRDGSGKRRTG